MHTLLAESDVSDLIKPIGALLLLLIITIIAVQALRKWMGSRKDEDGHAGGFTLGSLRQLVKEGKMSPEEFERAKSQIIAATQRAHERENQRAAEQSGRKSPGVTLPPDMKAPNDPRF